MKKAGFYSFACLLRLHSRNDIFLDMQEEKQTKKNSEREQRLETLKLIKSDIYKSNPQSSDLYR